MTPAMPFNSGMATPVTAEATIRFEPLFEVQAKFF
jgi:hypothetical protein